MQEYTYYEEMDLYTRTDKDNNKYILYYYFWNKLDDYPWIHICTMEHDSLYVLTMIIGDYDVSNELEGEIEIIPNDKNN